MAELGTYFITFLKSLAMRMNAETLQFFLHPEITLNGHECDEIFICDENRDVIAISMLNERRKNGGGFIAEEVGSLTTLMHFIVTHNSITGTIPTEIGNLHKLQTFILHDNKQSITKSVIRDDSVYFQ